MSPNSTILLDTGFLYALFDARDPLNQRAIAQANLIERYRLIMPWPVLYETLGTRFVKKDGPMLQFEALQKSPRVVLLPDTAYREQALEAVYRSRPKRSLSLVDMILRFVIEDIGVRTDALLTFNPGDFSDVCHKHRVELL